MMLDFIRGVTLRPNLHVGHLPNGVTCIDGTQWIRNSKGTLMGNRRWVIKWRQLIIV
jgi:hypothetical protein